MSSRPLSLSDDDFKRTFVEGRFAIDCVEIKLTQNDAAAPKVYVSIGSLRVSAEHGVEARLICIREPGENIDLFASFKSAASVAPGKLLPDSHYFRLEARDVAGNVWVNPSARIDISESLEAVVLDLKCHYVRCEIAAEPGLKQWTHMVLLDDLDFPLNTTHPTESLVRGRIRTKLSASVARGSVGELDLYYRSRSSEPDAGYSEIYAQTKEGEIASPSFQERLVEGIRFVTAPLAACVMIETSNDGVRSLELSKAQPLNKGMVKAPLSNMGRDLDFFRLLTCFFRYACVNAVGDNLSPLSAKLGKLYSTKGVDLATMSLMASVAVESVLADEFFEDLGKPDKAVARQVDLIFDAIKASSAPAELSTRAVSALGSMKSSRAVDKLYVLARAGVFDEAEAKRWKAMRNPTAHGPMHVDPKKMQKVIDDLYAAMALLHRLAFLRIGYDGPHTDYTVGGWPDKAFDATACLERLSALAAAPAADTNPAPQFPA